MARQQKPLENVGQTSGIVGAMENLSYNTYWNFKK